MHFASPKWIYALLATLVLTFYISKIKSAVAYTVVLNEVDFFFDFSETRVLC